MCRTDTRLSTTYGKIWQHIHLHQMPCLINLNLNRTRDPEKPVSDVFRVGIDEHGWRNLQLTWRRHRSWTTTINLRRLRKTVVVLHQRTPTQHSQDTHDQTYVLPDPQSFERSTPEISAGIESALDHARTVFTARTTREDTPVEQDTVTAGCGDYTHSPFSEHGAPCQASFLLCIACPNGVVTPRHLPRLAYLHPGAGRPARRGARSRVGPGLARAPRPAAGPQDPPRLHRRRVARRPGRPHRA